MGPAEAQEWVTSVTGKKAVWVKQKMNESEGWNWFLIQKIYNKILMIFDEACSSHCKSIEKLVFNPHIFLATTVFCWLCSKSDVMLAHSDQGWCSD